MSKEDTTNPSYYRRGKIEVADFIADQKLSYFEGNVVKYLCRYKYKNKLEDLKKAQWYMNKLIALYEEDAGKEMQQLYGLLKEVYNGGTTKTCANHSCRC